jgi:hypothetical protein
LALSRRTPDVNTNVKKGNNLYLKAYFFVVGLDLANVLTVGSSVLRCAKSSLS